MTSEELQELIDEIGNKFGRFSEGEFFPSLARVLSKRFRLEVICPLHRRLEEQTGKILMEMDGFGYSRAEQKTAIMVEIKNSLGEQHLQDLLDKLRLFPALFPEHRDKRLYGVIAAARLPEALKSRALNEGLFVAAINGRDFRLTDEPSNPRDFSQREETKKI